MGTKDIPQKSKLLYLSLTTALIAGNTFVNVQEINHLKEQVHHNNQVIKFQEGKLDEQGGLINQQKEEINQLINQKQKAINDLKSQKQDYDLILEEKMQEIQKLKKENEVSSSRGESYKEFNVEASGYTAFCNGCSGKTKWKELNLRQHPNTKVVAVDPSIIPLGSKVYVEGYGYAVAADTGGAIKGYKVDLFYPHRDDAIQWGRKTVKIRVFN